MKRFLLFAPGLTWLFIAEKACADYTWQPMITSTFFDGVRTDMLAACAGILGLALIIFGLAMLMRTVGR